MVVEGPLVDQHGPSHIRLSSVHYIIRSIFPTCAGADGVAADQGGPGGGAADGEVHLRSLSCL